MGNVCIRDPSPPEKYNPGESDITIIQKPSIPTESLLKSCRTVPDDNSLEEI